MDRDRFDALVRMFAMKGSRRVALGAIVTAALLGHDLAELDARGRNKKRGKRHKNKNKNKKDKKKDRRKRRRNRNRSCCGTKSCAPPSESSDRANCNYAGQSLAGGDHRNANLRQIDGRGTNFEDSDNRSVDFTEACLQGATFRRADLRETTWNGACLFDANFRDADVRGSKGFGRALFCRTTMPDGSRNDADCGRATRCCGQDAACLPEAASCVDGERASCCAGLRCVAGECASIVGPNGCPVEVCQDATRDPQGNCIYANSPNNQPGPACTIDGRFCCNGSCCREGDVCLATGCCTPVPNSQTCEGRCDAVTNNCGQQIECGDCAVRACQTSGCSQTTCLYANTANNQPGPQCPEPFFCCNGDCCREGDVCTGNGCCTPDVTSCEGRCGTFTDNCGQQHDCGACPPVICRSVTCDAQTHECVYTTAPNATPCTTASGQGGICCDGDCVAGGQCCSPNDCEPVIVCRPNLCENNQCRRVVDPDRTVCQGQFGEGICCGGFCFSDPDNQVCCQTSECPDRVCHFTLCSDNICQPNLLIPEGQQGPLCMGEGEFCCFGHCCTSGQQCVNFACSGP